MLDALTPEEYRKKFQLNQNKNQGIRKKDDFNNSSEIGSKKFESAIQEVENKKFVSDIDEFLKTLEKAEKKVYQNTTETSVEEYRNLLSGFLKKMNQNYRFLDYQKRNRMTGKTNVLRIYKELDNEVKDLGQKVITKQINTLMMLDKMKMIKGLIIDLKVEGWK
ncbi:MAG TPA: hypothetical protein DHW82_03650 [Spirochaetia bacterium]|nr:MAG: hypothetical protein A2Y41_06875 [Spirochaetes bacterium GWB1_36_13]HCL56088.1 hypothetical protein [Spirochaetia bacterium]